MSSSWGLLPLGIDESDLVMLLLAIFLIALLLIAMFMYLPLMYAVLGTLVIVLSIYYGVRELQKEENQTE